MDKEAEERISKLADIIELEGEYTPRGSFLLAKKIHDEGYRKPPNNKPAIICLCGSSRFCCEMAVIAWTFEKEGYITVGLHLLPADYTKVESHLAEAEGVAEKMDELHLRKIDLADEVFIVNKNGYIGESTTREIAYAKEQGKKIIYLESPNE